MPLLDRSQSLLTEIGIELFRLLHEEFQAIDERIGIIDRRIQHAFQEHEACRKIAEVEGVGPVIASAVVAAIADRARVSQRAAVCGLVVSFPGSIPAAIWCAIRGVPVRNEDGSQPRKKRRSWA
jgi:hypothetical protein